MRLIELFCLFVGNGHGKPTTNQLSSTEIYLQPKNGLATDLINPRTENMKLILCEYQRSRDKISLSEQKELRDDLFECQRKNLELDNKNRQLEMQIAKLRFS